MQIVVFIAIENGYVYVGGGTPDMSVMSMGFFPEIITIDAGDNDYFYKQF